MTYAFNLLDKAWIPCVRINGERETVSLRDALFEATDILEISHPSPLVTISLHRLLLAVLHRHCGPREGPGGPTDVAEWKRIWRDTAWNRERLEQYFDEWKDRFDLFNEEHPFYQTQAVSFDYTKSSAKLLHELASGNNKTLFDHTLMAMPPALTPFEAARLLVALQAYAIGGRVSYEKGRDKQDGSADNAFMVKGAALLATGRNLFETLMLNLMPYNAADEEPFAFDAEKDKPAWERDEDTRPEDRLPDGYLDWLTWQSRRVRLKPEIAGQGQIVIREAVIMKGFQLPDRQWRHGRETMVAFRKNTNAKGDQEPWPALAFTEEKALWRDAMSLLQSVNDGRSRPKTTDWLADLKGNVDLFTTRTITLSAYGLCSDQATVEFWRQETLPLPLAYLSDNELLSKLQDSLKVAETTGGLLRNAVWRLARLWLLPDESKEPGKEVKKEISRMCDNLAPARPYWLRLETPFKQLLEALPEDKSTDDNDATVYGTRLLPQWTETVRQAAKDAFGLSCSAVGESARALKARAKAQSLFHAQLKRIAETKNEQSEEGGEDK